MQLLSVERVSLIGFDFFIVDMIRRGFCFDRPITCLRLLALHSSKSNKYSSWENINYVIFRDHKMQQLKRMGVGGEDIESIIGT